MSLNAAKQAALRLHEAAAVSARGCGFPGVHQMDLFCVWSPKSIAVAALIC